MQHNLTLRLARPDDLTAVDDLLSRSYPRLLKADYAPSIMVTIVPLIARARPELLRSGRYFVVQDCGGRVVGAGGYSLGAPGPRGGAGAAGLAHIRHVATDPMATRMGIGRRLMQGIYAAAESEGVRQYDCLSTLTAVPFYAAMGFSLIGPVEVPISGAMRFPAMRMVRRI